MVVHAETADSFDDAFSRALDQVTAKNVMIISKSSANLADGTPSYEREFEIDAMGVRWQCYTVGAKKAHTWILVSVVAHSTSREYDKDKFSAICRTLLFH